jgi:hypothetical protein
MSHAPQGPGWWLASDGRWYPPPHPAVQSLHAQSLQAPVPVGPPAVGPPAVGPPAVGPSAGPSGAPGLPGPRPRKSVPTALVVVIVLLVVVGAGAVLAGNILMDRVTDRLTGQAGCEFVSDADASAVLGGQFEFVQPGGLTEMTKVAADVRPLPDGQTCLGSGRDGTGERVVTVVRLEAADAQARFDQARTAANGTKEDRGDGLSVETPGYFGKDVPLGDQAFCTTADLTSSSGVFVRRGNVLVYVSMTAAGMAEGAAPSLAAADEANCDLAQKLVAKIG